MKKISKIIAATSPLSLFLTSQSAWAITAGDIPSLQPANRSFTLSAAITNLLNIALWAAGLIAFVFLVYGGILFVTAQGDAAKVKTARDTILYAIIGVVIIVLALAILNWAKTLGASGLGTY